MFSTTTTKVRPGVPYDISRIYELLTPRPKVNDSWSIEGYVVFNH
jgi:hypothetical protein